MKMQSIPATMRTVDVSTGLETDVKEVRWGLLPPAADKCQVCAVNHEPHLFHDCRSLYYQYAFYGRQRRWPTWADATAHCAPGVVQALKDVLAANKLAWSAPDAGIAPTAHLGEAPAAPARGTTPVPADALIQPGQEMDITDRSDGLKKKGRILAVVPKGVSVDHAIADQNGEPRPLMVEAARHRSTLYVVEVTEANGRKVRWRVPQSAMKKGIAAGAKP